MQRFMEDAGSGHSVPEDTKEAKAEAGPQQILESNPLIAAAMAQLQASAIQQVGSTSLYMVWVSCTSLFNRQNAAPHPIAKLCFTSLFCYNAHVSIVRCMWIVSSWESNTCKSPNKGAATKLWIFPLLLRKTVLNITHQMCQIIIFFHNLFHN